MVDDVSINNAATLERCVSHVREEYAGDDTNLFSYQTSTSNRGRLAI
jgi:hypothetical protein